MSESAVIDIPATLAAFPSLSIEAQHDITVMANRLAVESGFDPATIAAIIAAIIQVIQGCKKPTPSQAAGMLEETYANHPDVCPMWLRGCFRKHGVSGFKQINNLWAYMVEDAHANPAAATGLLAS